MGRQVLMLLGPGSGGITDVSTAERYLGIFPLGMEIYMEVCGALDRDILRERRYQG